jgi:uncharacterized protein YutE (UPF0331/DUF86 family)
MTLIERLAQLRRHLAHLREIAARVEGPESLEGDLSLHNDVLFSLLAVAQLVIDIAGAIVAEEGHAFEDYTEAVRGLRQLPDFPPGLVDGLVGLPGFRNILIHEYVALDLDLVVRALGALEPIEDFARIVAERLARG